MSKDVLIKLRGKDFVPISVVANALFDGWNSLDVAAALKKIVTDDATPLTMGDEFGTLEPASVEARDWAIYYLRKCVEKPRLFSSRRVNTKVGWSGVDIANNKFILALLPSAQDGAEQIVGWYDQILDASYWLVRTQVTAREAATLLCNQNPLDDSSDPLLLSTDETNPLDFKRLLRVFNEAAELDVKPRTLMLWLDLANQNGLKYHSWIDEYIAAVETTKGAQGLAPPQLSTEGHSIVKPSETSAERNARLLKRHRELTGLGDKAPTKTVAKEEGCSTSLVRAKIRQAKNIEKESSDSNYSLAGQLKKLPTQKTRKR